MNFFWPVYKAIEDGFIDIAKTILIDDHQISVYSSKIGDLIIRCAIEIESISKELYKEVDGNMHPLDSFGNERSLYFDTDCLKLLEDKWKISSKEITIVNPNIYFSESKNRTIRPLHKAYKRGTSGSKWKIAYQAIKHNRVESIIKYATIKNLLYALGALYILNMYYKDESIKLGYVYGNTFDDDSRFGSDVFSSTVYSALGLQMNSCMDDSSIVDYSIEELDKALFIKKYDDNSFIAMHHDYCLDHEATIKNFYINASIATLLEKHPEYLKEKSINEICLLAGGEELLTKVFSFSHMQRNHSIEAEIVLNKNTNIYPSLKGKEFGSIK